MLETGQLSRHAQQLTHLTLNIQPTVHVFPCSLSRFLLRVLLFCQWMPRDNTTSSRASLKNSQTRPESSCMLSRWKATRSLAQVETLNWEWNAHNYADSCWKHGHLHQKKKPSVTQTCPYARWNRMTSYRRTEAVATKPQVVYNTDAIISIHFVLYL